MSNLIKCLNPNCSYENPPQSKFCQGCGTKMFLRDRYHLIRSLGEGGFGRTLIAVDTDRRNTQCVIKQFLPVQQGSGALQKCIQLFEQEADLLEKLGKHPQIPDLLAFFEQEGILYLIQEFIPGQNLLAELQQSGRLSETQVKNFLLEILPVLDFIHKKSVIHRDIKPENIIRRSIPLDAAIYSQVSNLVLIDFGVSKQVSTTVMTKLGTGVGTPGYAPPEQMRGGFHPSGDLYSLAVTAIRLLTGVLPTERNGSVVDEIFNLNSLSWVWKEWLQKKGISVNRDLAKVLDKMLQDRIDDRFSSAQEVLANLQPTSIPQPVVKPPQPIPQPISPPSPQVNLVTPKADLRKLEQLLSDKKWQEADQETGRVMLKIMNREKEGYLTEDNCRNFPNNELRIIDQLWLKHSNDKFGFSVQKKIWLKLGGKLDSYDYDTYVKLANEVGWKKGGSWLSYSDLTFNISAPVGHLPDCGWGGWGGGEFDVRGVVCAVVWGLCGGISFLFSRL